MTLSEHSWVKELIRPFEPKKMEVNPAGYLDPLLHVGIQLDPELTALVVITGVTNLAKCSIPLIRAVVAS
jgi:hypothetical protein